MYARSVSILSFKTCTVLRRCTITYRSMLGSQVPGQAMRNYSRTQSSSTLGLMAPQRLRHLESTASLPPALGTGLSSSCCSYSVRIPQAVGRASTRTPTVYRQQHSTRYPESSAVIQKGNMPSGIIRMLVWTCLLLMAVESDAYSLLKVCQDLQRLPQPAGFRLFCLQKSHLWPRRVASARAQR